MARTVFKVVFVLANLTTLLLLSCAAASDEDDAAAAAAAAADNSQQKSDGEAELKIEVISLPEECVQTTQDGNMLKVHYTGYLSNGKVFDSSIDRQPFVFPLGRGRVIKGWDQGLRDMCEGEKRRLIIPPSLGYGKTGAGDVIPPDETLTFEVELIEFQEMAQQEDSFRFEDLDLDKDRRLSRDEVKDYLWKMSKRLEEIAMQMETREGRMELINKVMTIHDKNKDDFIDEEEFYMPTDAAEHDEL